MVVNPLPDLTITRLIATLENERAQHLAEIQVRGKRIQDIETDLAALKELLGGIVDK